MYFTLTWVSLSFSTAIDPKLESGYTTHMEQEHMHKPHHAINKNTISFTIMVFFFIVAGMFVFAYLKNTEQRVVEDVPTPAVDGEVEEDRYRNITRIDGKHFYLDGVHTIVGEILMPTPCDLLNSNVMIAESYPEQVTFDFSVINNVEMCAQVITPARFKVSAQASEQASLSARLNGRSVILNLTPAEAGETPDEFELFIKG